MFLSAGGFRVDPFKVKLGRTIVAAGITLLLGMNTAFADDYADISSLLKEGQHAEALKKTDAALKQRPRDAQMRFLKGVILAEQNKTAEAITIFSKLTDDYPNLPEPYNNLAVLYAADNQYEKARIALDKAIRTNPSYATAYENLGDIHAKLASMAYDKALQLNSNNAGAKSKLTMVRTLVASSALPSAARTVTEQTPASPVPAAAKAPAVNVPPVAKAPAPSEKPASIPDKNADEKQASSKPESKPAPALANNNADRDAALALVQQWAKAWSAKDVKSYLSFYGNDFSPPKGMSRKEWTQERHARIAGKGRINVKVDSPQVTIKGNTATVAFRQTYDSDRLTATSRKTLVLAKQGNRWQIVQEKTGG
jgi:ketosteroid isomerase-like protein/cytochrome c-type biogenesis protein CcmH/NrfG